MYAVLEIRRKSEKKLLDLWISLYFLPLLQKKEREMHKNKP